jgi:microcystin-dependent protein
MSQPYIGQIILVGFNFAPPGWAFCQGQLLPIAENDALFALIGTTFGGDGESTFALPDLRGRAPVHRGQGPGLQNYQLGEAGGVEVVTLVATQLPQHSHAVDFSSLSGTLRCRNGSANQLTPVGGVPAVEATAPFTDAPFGAGTTPVRAVHVIELRNRIDALRGRFGLAAFPWTDPALTAGVTVVRALHLLDLRTALTQACAAGGLPLPSYAEIITAGTLVKAAHVTELQNAVLATPAGTMATYSNLPPDMTMRTGTVQMGGSVTAGVTGGSQPHSNLQPYLALNYLIALYGIFPSQG